MRMKVCELYENGAKKPMATRLAFNPQWRGYPGMISVKFCTEVRGWLRYKMA